jgi:hypothetical protein
VNVFKSWYEYGSGVTAENLTGSPDGQILNDNEFHADSYNFVTGDINKILCIWDTTNEGNSGAWKVTGVSSYDAVLDLRAGGSPTLTSQTGLRWRLIDIDEAPYYNSSIPADSPVAGWGLESPHSSGWRLFCRPNWIPTPYTWLDFWSSPVSAGFDTHNGYFDLSYPSTRDVIPNCCIQQDDTDVYNFSGYASSRSSGFTRFYGIVDDDNAYVHMAGRDGSRKAAYGVVGFTGADADHTEAESFVHAMSIDRSTSASYGNIYFANSDLGMHRNCAVGTKQEKLVFGVIGVLAYKDADLTEHSQSATAQANPFSGEESVRIPVMHRDFFATQGYYTRKLMTDFGARQSRVNIATWTLVGTDLFHIESGWCIPWPTGVTPLS